MQASRSHLPWNAANWNSPFHTITLACFVGMVSYLAAKVGGALVLHPGELSPLWPGCVLLVAVLLMVPRKIWPSLIAAGFAAFALYDLQRGVPIRTVGLLIVADTVEVVVAALCLSYAFEGVPRLNSLRNLAKYAFFAVILAPLAGAFVGALATSGNYWTSWRVSFFSEALGFLTLMPALLTWVGTGWARKQESRGHFLEAAALLAALVLLGYLTFVAPGTGSSPALLYSLIPLLLWSALRFGAGGVSTSVIVVVFLSIWGAVHEHGPFGGPRSVVSLQLFLFFTATPFMVLAALVEERTRADVMIRESEERFRLVANTAPVMIWMSGPDRLCTFFNKGWLNFTGRPMNQELGIGWSSVVHPDDLERCLGTYSGAFEARADFEMEYRLRRFDGVYRWVVDYGVPRLESNGTFCGYIGSCIDITDRKTSEAALQELSGRLIHAHEEERARIARELHDDLSQRMAMLQLRLEQFGREAAGLSSEARRKLRESMEVGSSVAFDIHSLSHQLHPSMIDTLGLTAALEGFCKEFSAQHNLPIQVFHRDIEGEIPKDISLCLYRIVQEALRNVVKHSGAAEAKVDLSGQDDRIDLCISDSGAGFDPDSAKAQSGVGLISMRERLRLVGGSLSVESRASLGTWIRVRVPLSKSDVQVTSNSRRHGAGA